MGATLIIAEPGAGKTSLQACLLEQVYYGQGHELLMLSRKAIERINEKRKIPLELPTEPPIYADVNNFKVKFRIGYNKFYEPYAINPYYMGVSQGARPIQYVLPYSCIFVPEIQVYADSRQGISFPRALSRLFEIRRHFHLEIYMDGHRGNFVDLKIRGLCDKIIDLQRQEHTYDGLGRIIKTSWHCREFKSIDAYDAYMHGKEAEYKDVTYIHNGNIFEDFNSFGSEAEFIPPEGKQFSMIKPMPLEQVKKLPPDVAQFYSSAEPEFFRKKGAVND